jgi:hypothetical protein
MKVKKMKLAQVTLDLFGHKTRHSTLSAAFNHVRQVAESHRQDLKLPKSLTSLFAAA